MLTRTNKLNTSGFSLVELMVVVAIIGILSAVAIPNFQRFQRKAKQSEAKSLLGGLYSAESAFSAEWSQYYGDLDDIGFIPNGSLKYNVGFTATNAAPAAPYTAVATSTGVNTGALCVNYSSQCTSVTTAIVGAVTPTATTFTAGAIGSIGGTTNTTDRWTMTQGKLLTNTLNGTF